MSLLTSKKAIITALSLGSIVLAGTITDINSRTVRKSQAALELDMIPADRGLASDEGEARKTAVFYLPFNQDGSKKIDGYWEITRIVGADEVVKYDKFANRDDLEDIKAVKLQLIETSTVKVDNDSGLVYKISLLSDFGTIALFKKIGNGYEILEARRVQKRQTKEQLAVTDEVELVLERGLNPIKSPKILTGDEATGEMLLTSKSIEGLRIDLKNGNGEDQTVDIASAELMEGGTFKAEIDGEEVSGVVFNNGAEGYRLSFVTGPLAGAMLNFVTKEQKQKMEDEAQDTYTNEVVEEAPAPVAETPAVIEVPMKEEMEMSQEQMMDERQQMTNDENQEPVQVMSAEEISETAKTQGFAF